MNFLNQLQQDIYQYLNASVDISQNVQFSQYKLIKRIYQFKNKYYPTGKISKNGVYKFYFDIITPRVNDEQKNVRILPQDVSFYSIAPEEDSLQVNIANKEYQKFSKDMGETEKLELIDSLYTEDGNVILKIRGNEYDICDPLNTFITNTTVESINDTNVIERKLMTATDLRKKKDVWDPKKIDEVIKYCGNRFFQKTQNGAQFVTTTPYYEVFEYTGEMPESALFQLQGKTGGADDKFVFVKFVIGGMKYGSMSDNYVLYVEDLGNDTMEKYYRHIRRGNYKGRFWGEGMYELLFDHQIRANEIGNQIARGLDFASKTIFKSTDLKTFSSVKTDIENGGIIRSADLQQVEVRMQGMDQLIADWNRVINDADRIANSSEVVYGGQLNSRTPFKLGNLLNENANKYFGLLKAKLGHFYGNLIDDFFKQTYLKDLKGRDIIVLTGSDEILEAIRKKIVDTWYLSNLVEIGPHSPEEMDIIKQEKYLELVDKDITINNSKDFWTDSLQRIMVNVVGENAKVQDNLQNLTVLMQMESDPARRAFLLDSIYDVLGVPIPPPPVPNASQVNIGAGDAIDNSSGKQTNENQIQNGQGNIGAGAIAG